MAPKCNVHLCYMYKKKEKKRERKQIEQTFEPGKETKRSLRYDGALPDVETPLLTTRKKNKKKKNKSVYFTQHLHHSLSKGSRSSSSAQSLAVMMSLRKWVWHHRNHFTLCTEELHRNLTLK